MMWTQTNKQRRKAKHDLEWADTAELIVTFAQKEQPILVLTKERFSYLDGHILATLTQEETLLFKEGVVFTQIKAKMRDSVDYTGISKGLLAPDTLQNVMICFRIA